MRRYVSWCADPAEPPTPAEKDNISLQTHDSAAPGSVPHLLLTPPETRGLFSVEPPQTTVTKRRHDERNDERRRRGHKEDSSPHLVLPRSSPVISRRHRPVSWSGGGTDGSTLPRSDAPSLDQHVTHEGVHLSSRCVSSNLNADVHLQLSEQQRLAEEQRGRGPCDCHIPQSPDLPPSANIIRDWRSSGIPEFSADLLKTRCELEQENSHFIVVDLVLEVLEGVKWTLMTETQQQTQGQINSQQHKQQQCKQQHKQHIQTSTCFTVDSAVTEWLQQSHNHKHTNAAEEMQTTHKNTHSYTLSHKHTQEVKDGQSEHQPKTFSVLSTDSGFEDGGFESVHTSRDSPRHAERLAQQLVSEFKRSWLPSNGPRRGRLSLRSSLQELPGGGGVTASSSSSLTAEIRLRTRMRGPLSWAPPPVQIIFSVQPNLRRNHIIALQNFLCAGCGTEFEHKHIKKLRYCDYLGRYFCDCCHSSSEAVIPARVLNDWDFSRFPVSDFSKQLLDSIWFQPLFDLSRVGKNLYGRVKELQRFRELQDQLLGIRRLLMACRLSKCVMTEFDQLPAHLSEQPHLFSMDDLLRAKKGQLVFQARGVLNAAVSHVENCQLCQARGFICEFCREKDIIFPFQTDVCRRCPVCRTCFHKLCFMERRCPKCARIQSRIKTSAR
ncbi:protein associated with UVRAG as autophagy enhancer isoform X2 [Cheilinus undulatus]|uniref:protein associated with UVRAG as autophagy enhancer isoform X2 n=1 Tax=Cheilinus undulatus TaxID=241271 RepID=UPI001BD49618|nr:protein associated with UVRAG as autophagy enhancer isoform X2 [Cheilinus undulatus]